MVHSRDCGWMKKQSLLWLASIVKTFGTYLISWDFCGSTVKQYQLLTGITVETGSVGNAFPPILSSTQVPKNQSFLGNLYIGGGEEGC